MKKASVKRSKKKPQDARAKTRERKKTRDEIRYRRFGVTERIEHLLLLVTFLLLAITGLPQKFASEPVSVFTIGLLGGIENARNVHHVSAIILMLVVIFHILEVGYKIYVKRASLSMMPGIKDVTDAFGAFFYNIGLRKKPPLMDRYTFDEKVEYWSMVWGTAIMAITGFIMWDPIAASKFLPGEIIPASKAAHGAEAILAVLAIIVWHVYFVHIKRFNTSMLTGTLSHEEMREDHPLELEELKKAKSKKETPLEILSKRKIIFYPLAVILGCAMLAGVYGLVSIEKTAITTIPPATSRDRVYVPLKPTPLPVTAVIVKQELRTELKTTDKLKLSWNNRIGAIFADSCVMCHSQDTPSGGLSFTSYAALMKGAEAGAVIITGDPEKSRLILNQSQGDHLGQLSTDDLYLVKEWIANGAPER